MPEGLEERVQVAVDRAECIGSGQCVIIAPRAFRLDDAMKAEIVDPGGEELDVLLEAAYACPTQAIYVSRAGASLFP
ncbi:MAG TPA: ferredoxin [Chloroflexota bacterium]|nr:ferredoxin [Chloroflexota bacterium]